MKELLDVFLELHNISLLRQKSVITALENKGVLTRADVDSIYDQIPETEAAVAREKVRNLFTSLMKESLGWDRRVDRGVPTVDKSHP